MSVIQKYRMKNFVKHEHRKTYCELSICPSINKVTTFIASGNVDTSSGMASLGLGEEAVGEEDNK